MEMLALFGFGTVLLLWFDNMRARERALIVARNACARHDVQLLDHTVALARIAPRRDPDGRMGLFRCYTFEFSIDGGTRRSGEVDLVGSRPAGIRLQLEPFTLHDEE